MTTKKRIYAETKRTSMEFIETLLKKEREKARSKQRKRLGINCRVAQGKTI